MSRRLLLYFAAFLLSTGAALAQTGKLQGKVTDAATKEETRSANIIVKLKGSQRGSTAADFNGNYVISPLNPGTYDVEVTSEGYNTKIISGVPLLGEQTRFLNIELSKTENKEFKVEILSYKKPIIDKDNTTTSNCGFVR